MKKTLLKTVLAASLAFAPLSAMANKPHDAKGDASHRAEKHRRGHKKSIIGAIKKAMEKSSVSEVNQNKAKSLMAANKESMQKLRGEMEAAHKAGDPIQISALKVAFATKQHELLVDIRNQLTETEWQSVVSTLKSIHQKRRERLEGKRGHQRRGPHKRHQ